MDESLPCCYIMGWRYTVCIDEGVVFNTGHLIERWERVRQIFQSLPTTLSDGPSSSRQAREDETIWNCDKFVIYKNRQMRAFQTVFQTTTPFFSTFFAELPLFHLFLSTRPPFYVGSKAICLKAFFLLHPSIRSYRNKFFFPPLL